MENQNASAKYPHKTGSGSLQSATPVAAFGYAPPLQWQHTAKKHL